MFEHITAGSNFEPNLSPLCCNMVHNETSAEAEQRLRGVLSSISQRDLVILRQMLPGQIRLATSSLVQGSATDNLRTFAYHSNVLSTGANHPAEDRVDCERRLRDILSGLPKRELHFLRQLVPQFEIQQPTTDSQSSAGPSSEPSRYPRPTAQPARCRSRSRSPIVVDRNLCTACGVRCSFPDCQQRCGKIVWSCGPPSHLRHYCQDHR